MKIYCNYRYNNSFEAFVGKDVWVRTITPKGWIKVIKLGGTGSKAWCKYQLFSPTDRYIELTDYISSMEIQYPLELGSTEEVQAFYDDILKNLGIR